MHRYEEATAAFQKAVAANPNYHYAWNNLGTLQMQRSDFDNAIRSFRRALSIRDEPATYSNLAICMWRICDWKDRSAVIERIREIVTKEYVVFLRSGCVFVLT
jgi:Flp pilus assembly protein TadD